MWKQILIVCVYYATSAHAQTGSTNLALGGGVSVEGDATCGGMMKMVIPGDSDWSGEKTCLSECPTMFNISNISGTQIAYNGATSVQAGQSNCHGLGMCSISAIVNLTMYETYTMEIKITRQTNMHMFTTPGCFLTLNNGYLELRFPETGVNLNTAEGVLSENDVHYLALQVIRGNTDITCNAYLNGSLLYTGNEPFDSNSVDMEVVSFGSCPSCPSIETVSVDIWNVMKFDRSLTIREISWVHTGDVPVLRPADACLCPGTATQANVVAMTNDWSLTCTTPDDTSVSEGRLVSNSGALYLSEFLVDGSTDPLFDPNDNDYVPQFWASKPGADNVTFTVQLMSVSKVNTVEITSLTPVPTKFILVEAINMYADPSTVAQVAQAADCSSSDIPDGTTCGVFSSTQSSSGIYTTTIAFPADAPVATAVKLTLMGLHNGTGDDSKKSHAITEVKAMGTPESYFVSLEPIYGPVAGGTSLTIKGDNLDMYTTRTISVGGTECPDVSSERMMLVCQTPAASSSSPQAVTVAYTLDDGSSQTLDCGSFTFKPNPTITSMEPRHTFARGGIRQTVIGTNLDSVAMPYLKTDVEYEGTTYPQDNRLCTVESADKMYCPTPELQMSAMTAGQTANAVASGKVSYKSGLILDGYTAYNDLSSSMPTMATIDVSPDPVIPLWNKTVRVFKAYDSSQVEIMGENLLSGCTQSDYKVMMADETCVIDEMDNMKIVCTPPSDQPAPTATSLNELVPLTKVTVGDMAVPLGYLKWHKTAWDDVAIRVAALCAIFAVALLVLVIFLIVIERIRSRKHWSTFKRDLFNSIDPKVYARGRNILVEPSAISRNSTIRNGYYASMSVGTLKGRSSDNKEDVLIKCLEWFENMSSESKMHMSKTELTRAINLHQVGHENVHGALAIALSKHQGILAAYPFVDRSDLKTYLRNPAVAIVVSDLTKMCSDVANAMSFLENQGIVHGDLAARNCMVDSQMTVYVSDNLGARAYYPKEYCKVPGFSRSISPRWMAPEYLVGKEVDTKCDVWSFGILFFEVINRCQYPYEHLSLNDIIRFVLKGFQLNKPEHCPKELYSLMQFCWEFQPEERPDFRFIADYLEGILSQLDMLRGGGERNGMSSSSQTPPVSRNFYEKHVPAPPLSYELSVQAMCGALNKGFVPDESKETIL